MIKKLFIIAMFSVATCVAAGAKPQCQSFNNYDGKVTIVYTDDSAGEEYNVTDVRLQPTSGTSLPAKQVEVTRKDGVVTVTLTFPHATKFSNPKVRLRINGKQTSFRACH